MSSTAGAVADAIPDRQSVPVEQRLIVVAVHTLFVLFVALSLMLLERRLVGAFIQPLSGGALVAAALLGGLTAAGLRGCFVFLGTPHSVLGTPYSVLSTTSPAPTGFFFSLPGAAAILLLTALTLPGTPAWGVIVAWFILIAAEAASWLARYRSGGEPSRNVFWPSRATILQESVEAEAPTPPGLIQQLTRVLDAGVESIHATVRAEVSAGDRLAIVHVAFCPPLSAQPELTAHALDADEAEVRVTQAETFGARIEVRLPRTDSHERTVLIEVLGCVTARESA